MIIKMHTVNGIGYTSLCRYVLYSLSLRKEKRLLGSRYKKHAMRLLELSHPGYSVSKIGILLPNTFSLNPVFIAVYKRNSARH